MKIYSVPDAKGMRGLPVVNISTANMQENSQTVDLQIQTKVQRWKNPEIPEPACYKEANK